MHDCSISIANAVEILQSCPKPSTWVQWNTLVLIWGMSPWQPLLWLQSWHPVLYVMNTLRPRQNGRHFADNIFKCIFLNENVSFSIKISPKFVPKGPIYNIPALVQIMAWRRPGDKPLSEPMMVNLPTHICVTEPQWVKSLKFIWRSVIWRWNLWVITVTS